MLKKILLSSSVLVLMSSAFAGADTIGPGGCASCLGSSYTLGYASTGTTDQYDVFLTVNATGYTGATTDVLNAVSLKIVSQTSDFTAGPTLISAPTGFTTTIAGGISSGGCNGSGNGFFCSGGTGLPVGGAGDIYTWEWVLTVGSASDLMTGSGDASVKASYLTAAGGNAGITSEDITLSPGTPPPPVPEPSTLVLLGTGLLGAAGAVRRRLVS
jgi:hypothetical protein